MNAAATLTDATTIYAVIEDVTPSRATVVAVGPDAEDLRAEYEHRHDVKIVEVDAATTVGERVWISSDVFAA